MTPESVPLLDTSAGEFKLQEYRLRQGDREWTVLHTGAVLTREDELRVIGQETNRLPYGVAIWPSAIALVHEIATRAEEISGRRILELGAGTGLPGIVAASLGARVVQSDRDELRCTSANATVRGTKAGLLNTAWRTGRSGATPSATIGSSVRISSTANRFIRNCGGSLRTTSHLAGGFYFPTRSARQVFACSKRWNRMAGKPVSTSGKWEKKRLPVPSGSSSWCRRRKRTDVGKEMAIGCALAARRRRQSPSGEPCR